MRTFFVFVTAAVLGATLGDAAHTRQAEAASTQISMWCQGISSNAAGTLVSENCTNALTDVSGVGVNMTITQATQRYQINTTATITLP